MDPDFEGCQQVFVIESHQMFQFIESTKKERCDDCHDEEVNDS